MNFRCHIQTETKVADNITLGEEFSLQMLSGRAIFTVTSIEGDSAVLTSGRTLTYLKKQSDGWYDQHIRIGAGALERLKNLSARIIEE